MIELNLLELFIIIIGSYLLNNAGLKNFIKECKKYE